MPKPKRPPRDYGTDLRIKPYVTEDTTDEEAYVRFRRGVRSMFKNDPPLPKAPQPKK